MMNTALATITQTEPLPFERHHEDSDRGWELFQRWLEAPSDMALNKFANTLGPDNKKLALREGLANDWTRRRLAYYRHIAELSAAETAIKATLLLQKSLDKWTKIMGRITDGVDEDSPHAVDVEIERLRVITESVERVLKSATGSKFATAFIVNNSIVNKPKDDGTKPPPALDGSWDVIVE